MTEGSLLERTVATATDLAASHRHNFVGTEHLLAGLLQDSDGFAATLIAKTGLDLGVVRAGLMDGLRQASESESAARLSVSRFAERALEMAKASAAADGRAAVEERDLLQVLIAQPKGRMAQLLKGDGTALLALRAALGTPPPAPAAPRPERKAPDRPEPKPKPAEAKPARPAREPRPPRGGPAPSQPRPPRGAPEPEERDPRPLRIARPDPPRRFRWSLLLLLAVPASVGLSMMNAAPILVFVTACVAVLPLAGLMGEATESLAERTGPTIGGLLNATFGNAAELIIAIVALKAGLIELVKASITGSILGNLLLILGLSFIAAGTKTPIVKFNRANAGMSAAMLALAVIGLVFPALFHATHGPPNATAELYLSEAVSVILIATYLLSLLFSLKTHRALFGGGDHPAIEPKWRVGPAIGILALATAGIVIESELLVHSVQSVTATFGLTQTFVGLVIIPIIGNAAEHATAIVVARKGQTDLALQIALGSSTQIALLVAPVLVFVGLFLGTDMNLVFPVFDVAALAVSTIVIAIITLDGETHWFEGAQLLAVYAMMAAAAFFI